tara:strand:+ start:403 stop:507 length:105 start_codon:yes stop_codon:yes gene_type:complete
MYDVVAVKKGDADRDLVCYLEVRGKGWGKREGVG